VLLWSGDKREAQKQFGIASHLDLSAADRAALAGASGGHFLETAGVDPSQESANVGACWGTRIVSLELFY
jgi:hypothetical protein